MTAADARRALTRAEILVCMFAVGALAALLAPALQQLRSSARRHQCAGNLQAIGLAVLNYGDVHRSFPYGTCQTEGLPTLRRFSWYVAIFAYLESSAPNLRLNQQERWDSRANLRVEGIDRHSGGVSNYRSVPVFVCPSAKLQTVSVSDGVTFSHIGIAFYFGVAGVGADAPTLSAFHPRAGLWGYDRCMRLDDNVVSKLSSLLLLAETSRDVGPWVAGGPTTVRGFDPDGDIAVGATGQLGGHHTGGANVAAADNSVRFLNDTVDPDVLAAMCAVAGAGTRTSLQGGQAEGRGNAGHESARRPSP